MKSSPDEVVGLSPNEVDDFVANNKPIMQLKSSPRRQYPRCNPFVVTTWEAVANVILLLHSICCINGRKVCDDCEYDEGDEERQTRNMTKLLLTHRQATSNLV